MIRFIQTQEDRDRFYRLCRGSAFGCKLAAVADSYGFEESFARFWLDASAAYCQLDGDMALAGFPEDPEEAAAFLPMAGAKAVSGPAGFLEALGLSPKQEGPVLGKMVPPGPAGTQGPVRIKEIHALLAELHMAGDWESFYLDLSHRLRHGTALAVAGYAGGRLAGCGLAVAAGKAAVLSALGVREGFRRQGLGTALVRRLEALLPGKKLYAFREAGKNKEFYQSLGFTEEDRWSAA